MHKGSRTPFWKQRNTQTIWIDSNRIEIYLLVCCLMIFRLDWRHFCMLSIFWANHWLCSICEKAAVPLNRSYAKTFRLDTHSKCDLYRKFFSVIDWIKGQEIWIKAKHETNNVSMHEAGNLISTNEPSWLRATVNSCCCFFCAVPDVFFSLHINDDPFHRRYSVSIAYIFIFKRCIQILIVNVYLNECKFCALTVSILFFRHSGLKQHQLNARSVKKETKQQKLLGDVNWVQFLLCLLCNYTFTMKNCYDYSNEI